MQRDVALSLAVKLIARHVRAVDVKHASKQKGGESRGERREVPKLGFSAVGRWRKLLGRFRRPPEICVSRPAFAFS